MQKERIFLTEKFPYLTEIGIVDFRCKMIKEYRTDLSKHHHGRCYEIGYVTSGIQGQLLFSEDETSPEEAQQFELRGDDLIMFSPYAVHSTAPGFMINAFAYWLVLDPDCPCFLNYPSETSALLKDALRSIRFNTIHLPKAIASRLSDAFNLLTNPSEMNILRAYNLLSLFILKIAEFDKEYVGQSSEFSSLSPSAIDVAVYINNNLFNPELTLDSIAEYLHYSRGYTSTFIKKELGMTLQDFIAHSKIQHACKLLRHYSITEVAMMLNLSSSQYFSYVFKKYMYMTPSEYRVCFMNDI